MTMKDDIHKKYVEPYHGVLDLTIHVSARNITLQIGKICKILTDLASLILPTLIV